MTIMIRLAYEKILHPKTGIEVFLQIKIEIIENL